MQSAILAVLQTAKNLGMRGLTKTALMKYIYLLDCFYAQEHNGTIQSGSGWYLHHYGPFAVNLTSAIDEVSNRGLIQSRSGEYGNKDFSTYWLGEYPIGPEFTALGLSSTLSSRLTGLIRKFQGELPRLLDYVYFETVPMKGAEPGKPLDFSSLPDANIGQQLHHTHIKDQSKIMRLLQLSEAIKNKHEARKISTRALNAHKPIYDAHYFKAMADADFEDEDGIADIAFTAKI
ncbi:hypothetical protein ACDI97_06800 [Xanthomonas axonopodis pv. fascicularis]|uniref:hypothetical protein n=1 Tax=Xanthomonas TaxID=338 RepID=UPI00163A4E19|nr:MULTISPECIES: hypothetical protein [Xanthomonas]MBV6804653.1 hypothetical protein [Xanthomonas campestris pv. convolvuli]